MTDTTATPHTEPMVVGFWEMQGTDLDGCKFVVGEYCDDQLIMWVFPKGLVHLEIARRKIGLDHVVSAGFIRRGADGDWECHGLSESLGDLAARPEDTEGLRAYLRAPEDDDVKYRAASVSPALVSPAA